MMKALKLLYKLLVVMSVFPGISSAQDNTVKIFGDTCCYGTARPLQLLKGQQVLVQCDTAILINKTRFSLYEKARTYIINTDNSSYKSALDEYEKALKNADKSYREIYTKYMEVSQNYSSDLDRNNKELISVRQDLVNAQSNLKSASDELEKLRKKIERQKRHTVFGNILWGAGGALLGIIAVNILN